MWEISGAKPLDNDFRRPQPSAALAANSQMETKLHLTLRTLFITRLNLILLSNQFHEQYSDHPFAYRMLIGSLFLFH